MHEIYIGKCRDPIVTQSKLATYRPNKADRPWRVVDRDTGHLVDRYDPPKEVIANLEKV